MTEPLDLTPIRRRRERWAAVGEPSPLFLGTAPAFVAFYDHAPEDVGDLLAEVDRLSTHLHAIGAHPDFKYGVSPDRGNPFFAGWEPNPDAADVAEPNAVHDRWFWKRRKAAKDHG